MSNKSPPLPVWIFGLGTFIGLMMVFFDSFMPASKLFSQNDKTIIATVNGQSILREDYETLLEMLAIDKRNPITATDRSRALQRLIDEELLIQEGIAIGLTERDTTVRKAISAAMIGVSRLGLSTANPTDRELRSFYKDHQDSFVTPALLEVSRFVADTDVGATSAARLGLNQDDPINPIPDSPLSPKMLRGYIGPTALQVVMSLQVGEESIALPHGDQFQVLKLNSRKQSQLPAFEEMHQAVLFEYRRQRDEKALSDYLKGLRDKALLEFSPENIQ